MEGGDSYALGLPADAGFFVVSFPKTKKI